MRQFDSCISKCCSVAFPTNFWVLRSTQTLVLSRTGDE